MLTEVQREAEFDAFIEQRFPHFSCEDLRLLWRCCEHMTPLTGYLRLLADAGTEETMLDVLSHYRELYGRDWP